MTDHLFVFALASMVGVGGTCIGAFLAYCTKKRGNRFISSVMEFSAGLCLAIVCFDLLPNALLYGSRPTTFLFFVLGVIASMLLQQLLKFSHTSNTNAIGMKRTSLMMMVGLALHNFPEGLAIGSSFEVSPSMGIFLMLVVIIHEIPEGLALALPLRYCETPLKKSLFYAAITGLPLGFGGLVGVTLGGVSKGLVGLCLAFAGGSLLYIICGDIIPESKHLYNGRMNAFGNILGFIIGMCVALTF